MPVFSPDVVRYPNLLINGGMDVFARTSTPGTDVSQADDTYAMDRWYVLVQTASINAKRSTGNVAANACTLTQDEAGAQRFGLAQIVENYLSKPVRSQNVSLSLAAKISNSQALRYAILEWTGTADSVTSDVVNDWTSATYTAGNFFLAASLTIAAVGAITPSAATWTTIQLDAAISASCNNLIVLVWTEGTAAQNVTLELSEFVLGLSPLPTVYSPRTISEEQLLCERYFAVLGDGMTGGWDSATQVRIGARYRVPMRSSVAPTLLTTTPIMEHVASAKTGSGSAVATQTLSVNGLNLSINGFTGATANTPTMPQTGRLISVSAEL